MTTEATLLGRALSGDVSWTSGGDWDQDALAAAAGEHGVTALLWASLGTVTGRGASLRDSLAPMVRAAATRDLLVQQEMRALLEAVSAAGARAMIFKGSALAYTVYAQPWHRPRSDTDLLASTTERPLVADVIESCGYARTDALTSGTLVSHQVAYERTDAHGLHHVVDLHWKIVNPQVLADVLSFDVLWRDAESAPALGRAARVPSRVASALLACVHRLAHHQGQDRLIWLYDLKLLAGAFGPADWVALRDLAIARGVAGLCLDGLREARRHLGIRLPADLEAALAAAAPGEASRQYLEGPVHKRDVLLSDLSVLPTWRARLRLLREHAFPPAAFIRQRYGVRNPLWLPVLYVHRLVTGASKWVRP